jgi:hypothetical protein
MGWHAGEKTTTAKDAVQAARDSFVENHSEATDEEKEQFEVAIVALEAFVTKVDPERTIKARCQGHVRESDSDRTGTYISVTVAEHITS